MKENHRLLKYGLKNIHLYIISLTCLFIQVNLDVKGPMFLSRIIDNVILNKDYSLLPQLLLFLILSYVGCGLFAYLQEFTSDVISKRATCDLRRDVFSSITLKDGSFFSSRTPADLMSRTTSDTENIGFIYGFCSIYLIELCFSIVMNFRALVRVSKIAGIVPLVFMPIVGFLAFFSELKGDKYSDAISDKKADLNTVSSEALTGIRTVKSFGSENKERRAFHKEALLFRNLNTKFDSFWFNWGAPQDILSLSMLPLSLLVGGYLAIQETITLGELSQVVQYTTALSWPMMEIGWVLVYISSARAGWRKVKKILNEEPKIKDGKIEKDNKEGEIEFRNVSFERNGKTLIKNISFKIERGKTVAIMGESGSGKSLITSMALRFIDPTCGSVLINGTDCKDMTLSSVRGFSSIVTQDVFLFSDTVMNNIALGKRKNIDEEKIKRVSKEAEASEFIEKLENGYETIIGEKGVGLSGGQKQRLSIARAFMRDNQLLILDDATSALDMETEREIEETIKRDGKRSLLITAHRISAVSSADEILYLDKGEIVERGTHKELLKKKGLYYKTYISQFPEEEGEV